MLLELNPEKVCFLIVKLREYAVETESPTGNSSNASDDGFVAVYLNDSGHSVRKEIEQFIGAMDVDEQRELIALCLIGGSDFSMAEWPELLKEASEHPEPTTAAFILGLPKAADQLEEGLALFDLSCNDFAQDRL